jgi:uracil-DNA glycosylase
MKNIQSFLKKQVENGKIIYPKSENIFNALNSTPLDEVRVVIIGQDPYH